MKIILHFVEGNTLEPELQLLLKSISRDIIVGKNPIIEPGYSHILRVDQFGLSLLANQPVATAATRVDFLDKALLYRRDTSGKSTGIAKAVGLNKRSKESDLPALTILDATAGLGKDAYILASLGCRVILMERSNVIHALLADGFRRGLVQSDLVVQDTLRNMTLLHQDARVYFEEIIAGLHSKPDVIYLDPMFPVRNKTAKVKKDIALLQEVLGVDQDFSDLLKAARNCATHRVVVKRPGKVSKHANDDGVSPSFQISGKSAHFDVYV